MCARVCVCVCVFVCLSDTHSVSRTVCLCVGYVGVCRLVSNYLCIHTLYMRTCIQTPCDHIDRLVHMNIRVHFHTCRHTLSEITLSFHAKSGEIQQSPV